ncbi:dTDP-4-dehydrorhamnose 3,5-epimerase family protein [Rhodobacteraceae bacterium]|nr:dTDP-4-dehydrorhamnose 3,5-epimerase family protein [Paracoccaceae bacterium]
MIEGVKIHKLNRICDERGSVWHMLRSDAEHFEKFGEIYFATIYPGVVKGWHEHTLQTQNYAVIDGMIKLVLYDNRPDTKTYQKLMEVFLGDEDYKLVTIPPGIVNGYKSITSNRAIVANCSTLPHSPGEMIRHNPHDCFIEYNWNVLDS